MLFFDNEFICIIKWREVDDQGVCHAFGRRELHSKFWSGNRIEIDLELRCTWEDNIKICTKETG